MACRCLPRTYRADTRQDMNALTWQSAGLRDEPKITLPVWLPRTGLAVLWMSEPHKQAPIVPGISEAQIALPRAPLRSDRSDVRPWR